MDWKCKNCNMFWYDEDLGYETCHADPNWPTPCEYEDDYEEEGED